MVQCKQCVHVFADPPVETISICTTILNNLRKIKTLEIVFIGLVYVLCWALQLQTKMFACSFLVFPLKRCDHEDARSGGICGITSS